MKNKVYVYLFLALVILYVGLSVGLPTAAETLQKYHLTQAKARLIYLSISIPLAAIWLLALYSFYRFKVYAGIIAEAKEGKAFNQLASGLMVLAFSLPLNSLFSTILTYISSHNHDFEPASVIMRNYLTLAMQLVAFILIAKGADNLLRTLRTKPHHTYPRFWNLIIITASSLFTWLIIARAVHTASGAPYYLPVWLIVTTLTIPYLYTWYKGVLAAWRLQIYRQKVKGVIYKQMLGSLVAGISFIIGLSILQRVLITVSERLSRLNVTPLLMIIYILIALTSIGYVLVARGARQLKKIEEV